MASPPAPARIGIDGRNLGLSRGTGVATYAAMLAACLPRIGLRAELLSPHPALPRPLRWLAAAWPGPAPSRVQDGTRLAADVFRIAQVHFDLYGRLRAVGGHDLPDVMHWTYPLPLALPGRPNLYTVHDLIPLLHPGLTGIGAQRFRRILARVLQRADHVVTVSEATRRELVSHLGLDPARITNTLQAIDVSGAVAAEVPFLLPRRYWLHVGAVERRKNLPRLIEAWRASGTPHPLVLAGPDGWMAAETLAAAAPFMRPAGAALDRPAIVRLPWLPRPQLLGLMREARALLMPSLAEGFGLPVAEAMALGTPVLTSSAGALAEVAGEAALRVDPQDGAAIAQGLRALDADDLRARLAASGLAQAAAYTPAAYADRLDRLYRGVRARS